MVFKDFKNNEPAGQPYTHMNFDGGFQWDTKDDANDKDNGFICKRSVWQPDDQESATSIQESATPNIRVQTSAAFPLCTNIINTLIISISVAAIVFYQFAIP